MEGETELAFAHALVRDVAYGQISRPDRIESTVRCAVDREARAPGGRAEMLAYHWRSSLDLRAPQAETPELVDATRLALRNAGDRAVALNAFGPAEAYYGEALAIWPEEAPHRADLVFRRAHALFVVSRRSKGTERWRSSRHS